MTVQAALRLSLYARRYCHLCDDMLSALRPLQENLRFEVEVVDVDQDDGLEARYGGLVPVLAHGDTVICHYHLDAPRLTAYLSSFR